MKAIALSALVLALATSLTVLAAPKAEKKAEITQRIYFVCDLPVYRATPKEAKFDPDLLIKHLRATVDPQSWENGALIKVDEKQMGLIIGQTEANHEAIADTLSSIRGQRPGEVTERLSKKSG